MRLSININQTKRKIVEFRAYDYYFVVAAVVVVVVAATDAPPSLSRIRERVSRIVFT